MQIIKAVIGSFLVVLLSVNTVFADITWDPSKQSKNAATISDQKLEATLKGIPSTVLSTEYKTQGKWYWEIEALKGSNFMIGVAAQDYKMDEYYIGATKNSYAYWKTGDKYNGSAGAAGTYGPGYAAGDIIGVAMDLDNRTLEFYKNGEALGVAFKNLIPGNYCAAVSNGDYSGDIGIKARFKSSDFKYTIPNGFLPLDGSIQNNSDETITLENSINEIKIGQEFEVEVVLHNGVNICAEDIFISYDKNLFEYQGYEDNEGFKVYKEIMSDLGIRFISVSKGKVNAINGKKAFVKLKFRAKQQGTGKIDVVTARIADNGNFEKDIQSEFCGEKLINVNGIKDINRTGTFTLLDLAIDAWYYGTKAEDTDSAKFDCDVVINGTIDDSDLMAIVTAMLENDAYKPHE